MPSPMLSAADTLSPLTTTRPPRRGRALFFAVAPLVALAALSAPAAHAAADVDADLNRALHESVGPYRIVALFFAEDLDVTTENGRRALAQRRDIILRDVGLAPDQVRRVFRSVPAIAVTLDAAGVVKLSEHPRMRRLGIDPSGQGALTDAHAVTHVLDVHALGFLGAGVTVGVLDSGLDLAHVDVNDSVAGQACFCAPNCCPNGTATQTGAGAAQDDHGHGTHVSGIVASAGTTAPIGVAPEVSLYPVKVLSAQNTFQSLSDITAGLDHLFTSGVQIDVVNMSLGTNQAFPAVCDDGGAAHEAVNLAAGNLVGTGTALFASTGNVALDNGIQSPSCLSNVVGVVATYDRDFGSNNFGQCFDNVANPDVVACFSNVSPAAEIAAPGYNILSARRGGGSTTMFGTSMASPQVAGCAALLKSARPSLSFEQIREALRSGTSTSQDLSSGRQYPRLDCPAAFAYFGLDGESDAGPTDGGTSVADAGNADGGDVDGGANDGGQFDGGDVDGGANDAGDVDAGDIDAGPNGTSDAGVNDAGTRDAGTSDAGVNDAGVNDAGTNDAGVNDAGVNDAGVNDAGASENDAGEGDAGPGDDVDAGTTPDPEPGCTCDGSGSAASPLPLVFALLAGLMLRRRRHRSA